MLKIAHIINPVRVNSSSDLYVAQPITFATMKKAQECAQADPAVQLYAAFFPEDEDYIPDYFVKTEALNRSILDIKAFKRKRKIPLIKDIIDRLYKSSDADYYIYTNVDIALQPYFYKTVSSIIEEGYDAFSINRRTIRMKGETVPLATLYAEAGSKHPGHDCFIFSKKIYPHFGLGTACIGADWIGKVILTNLICHSTKFKVFEDLHLTFHLGDERNWRNPAYSGYDEHNREQLHNILKKYKNLNLLNNKPLVDSFWEKVVRTEKPKRNWGLRFINALTRAIKDSSKTS